MVIDPIVFLADRDWEAGWRNFPRVGAFEMLCGRHPHGLTLVTVYTLATDTNKSRRLFQLQARCHVYCTHRRRHAKLHQAPLHSCASIVRSSTHDKVLELPALR